MMICRKLSLVLEPFHGLLPFYGGGEEGNWQRSHLGEPFPWWLKHEYLTLCYTNLENDTPIALTIYALGYLLTILGWCGWLVWLDVFLVHFWVDMPKVKYIFFPFPFVLCLKTNKLCTSCN